MVNQNKFTPVRQPVAKLVVDPAILRDMIMQYAKFRHGRNINASALMQIARLSPRRYSYLMYQGKRNTISALALGSVLAACEIVRDVNEPMVNIAPFHLIRLSDPAAPLAYLGIDLPGILMTIAQGYKVRKNNKDKYPLLYNGKLNVMEICRRTGLQYQMVYRWIGGECTADRKIKEYPGLTIVREPYWNNEVLGSFFAAFGLSVNPPFHLVPLSYEKKNTPEENIVEHARKLNPQKQPVVSGLVVGRGNRKAKKPIKLELKD